MNLDAYFERIGYSGTPTPSIDTLRRVHHAHLSAIPYENLDVQLGHSPDLDLGRAYAKLVQQRRGGWCYEMNGVLGWALEEIGFEVMRMSGGVLRAERGDDAIGNHLVLCIKLDETWVADAGLGDGPAEPYPLRPHAFDQRGFAYRLERLGNGWRFHNYPGSTAASFDFWQQPADEQALADKCQWLSTAPESPFQKALVCQRVVPGGYDLQVGLVATRITPRCAEQYVIGSADELVQSLVERFDLNVPELADNWETIQGQHEAYLATRG